VRLRLALLIALVLFGVLGVAEAQTNSWVRREGVAGLCACSGV